MKGLGGVRYCENLEDGGLLNVARMLRDSSVNSIWEGTTNITAEDVVRVTKSKGGQEVLAALGGLINRMLGALRPPLTQYSETLQQQWAFLHEDLLATLADDLLYQGRSILQRLQTIVSAPLLCINAISASSVVETVIAASREGRK